MRSNIVENPFNQVVTSISDAFNTSKNFFYHHVDDVCEDSIKLSAITGAYMVHGSITLRFTAITASWFIVSGPAEYIGDQVEYLIKGEISNETKSIFKLPNIGDAGEDIFKIGILVWQAGPLLALARKHINLDDRIHKALSVLTATKAIYEIIQNYIGADNIGDNAGKWIENIIDKVSHNAHEVIWDYIGIDDTNITSLPPLPIKSSNNTMICIAGDVHNSTHDIDF